ncbi:hypothetical protein L207DRAFT_516665 [Hyaloscypha variabilis F]|uniref:Roadblock/LAMTOR2 domain-containing protein n=1 Tax=Hyaloscypha variabilis (strain UAMH 11265 / GT02V1 / F) TaxID=1149755 RepID=A0A2J6RB37_HYAVF|nr:hypothetical protein L207DRAFT_516665 [Hyaloscypha variabilis F]
MSNTMLLTKRLTTFLSQNTTPALPTLLLLSPTGKLLSSASPISASILRTQATLACSLWTLYQPTVSSVIPSVLPAQSDAQSNTHPRGSDATLSSTTTVAENDHELASIAVQLTHGVMVIRALSCGLLFVAIGPSSPSSISPSSPSHTLRAQSISSPTHTSPPSSPPPHGENGYNGEGAHEGGLGGLGSGAPSEAGSARSTGRMASIMGIKRQAEEVGRWLDGQLDGFQLSSAEGR